MRHMCTDFDGIMAIAVCSHKFGSEKEIRTLGYWCSKIFGSRKNLAQEVAIGGIGSSIHRSEAEKHKEV